MSVRLIGALTRWALLLHRLLRVRMARLLLAGLVTTAITGVVLAVPVIAGGGTGWPSAVFDSSSSTSPDPDGVTTPEPVFEGAGQIPPRITGGTPAPSAPVAPTPSAENPTTAAETPAPAAPSTGSPSASSPSAGPAPSSSTEPTPSTAPMSDTAPPPPAPVGLDPGVQLLALVDQARAAAGCDPLSHDGDLSEEAEDHSRDMRDDGFVGLVDDDGDSVLDEGARSGWVAVGTLTPEDVVSGWPVDGSLGDCTMESVGIGVAEGDSGPWWTLLLA